MSSETELEGPAEAPANADTTLARLLLDHVEQQIRATDTKAVLIVTANAFLANSLVALVSWPGVQMPQATSAEKVLGVFRALLTIVAFLTLIVSTLYALLVIRPRLAHPDNPNLLFFGTISGKSEQQFIDEFRGLNSDQIYNSLLAQIHIKSQIAMSKFQGILWSIRYLFVGLGVWTLVIILHVAKMG